MFGDIMNNKLFKAMYVKLFVVLTVIGVASFGFLELNGTSTMTDAVGLVFASTLVTYVEWGVIAVFVCKGTQLAFRERYGENMIGLISVFGQLVKSLMAWLFLVSILAFLFGGILLGNLDQSSFTIVNEEKELNTRLIVFLFSVALIMYFALIYAKQVFNMFVYNKVLKLAKKKSDIKGYTIPVIALKLSKPGRSFMFVLAIIALSLLKGYLETQGLMFFTLLTQPLIGVFFCALMVDRIALFTETKLTQSDDPSVAEKV